MHLFVRHFWMALIALFAASGSYAQDETALARKVYEEVNKQLPSLARTSLVAKRPDVEYKSEVKAWSDKSGVRKIETTDRDDDGNVVTEYYFADGALVFAYVAIKGFDKNNRQVTRSEDRQYFRDGKMFRWLGGKDKILQSPTAPGFADEGKMRLAAARFFADAVSKASRPAGTR